MAKRSKKTGIGLVGLGFMGLTHYRAARSLRSGRLVALATSDPRKARGDFSGVRGNFGEGGGQEDVSDLSVYPTLAELLGDDRVDLVDICLPSHLHAQAAMQCLAAGKAVLVEKPIALGMKDAKAMLRAAESAGRPLLVGQVLKFFGAFAALEKLVRSGKHGRLLALHHRRIIAKPSWGDDDWLGDPARSGGMCIDLHVHDTDFILHLLGRPKAVSSWGLVRGEDIDSIRTRYEFEGGDPLSTGPLVTAEAGWINGASLPFEHGYDAWFEKATIQYNSTTCPTPRVFGPRGVSDLAIPDGDGFALELEAAAKSVATGEIDPRLSAATAAQSIEVCLAEVKSARTGRRVAL